MEGSLIDLSKYRFECALEDLDTAKCLLSLEKYAASVNRSYYAIFHALRSVTILESFDSKKHSGVIAYFNSHFVKTGVFNSTISEFVKRAFKIRENADYKDFFIVSKAEAEEQIKNAEAAMDMIRPYLDRCWNEV